MRGVPHPRPQVPHGAGGGGAAVRGPDHHLPHAGAVPRLPEGDPAAAAVQPQPGALQPGQGAQHRGEAGPVGSSQQREDQTGHRHQGSVVTNSKILFKTEQHMNLVLENVSNSLNNS